MLMVVKEGRDQELVCDERDKYNAGIMAEALGQLADVTGVTFSLQDLLNLG